jgi:uncharacterized protein YjbI with pentapeptide repeats
LAEDEASRANPEVIDEPEFVDAKVALERIEALTTTARTTWLVLLGFLAFIGLTLLSVRDVDFFSVSATTDLPLVNIAIPTTTFFWTAALLAAILHTYFHVFLLKLWDALAEAPPVIDELKLGDRVFPWLVNDWALRRRKDRPVTKRPLDLLGSIVTGLVIWLATPFVLAGFWWRSLPAHDARLSLAIAAAFLLTLFASLRGWRRARKRLSSPGSGFSKTRQLRRGILGSFGGMKHGIGVLSRWFAMSLIAASAFIATVVAAGGHSLPLGVEDTLRTFWPERWNLPLARANLIDAEIAIEPDDWRDREIARRRFHVQWCADAGLPEHACETPEHPDHELARQRWCEEFEIAIKNGACAARFREIDAAFEDEWTIERKAYIDNIRGPDLRERDLRNAFASGAFLAGVDLRRARLDGAILDGAYLEGADLRWVELGRAVLSGARLEEVRLSQASLQSAELSEALLAGANLFGARLEGADLLDAQLEEANLTKAILERTVLRGARLEGADLFGARLQGADLSWASLEGAILHHSRLDGADL